MSDIQQLSSTSKSRELWNQYLADAPDANFYQRFEWQELNESHFGHQVYPIACSQEGRINGVLPIVLINSRLFGRIMCSMPFVNFGGACADSIEIENDLVKYAMALANESKVDYLEMRASKSSPLGLEESTKKVSLLIKLEDDHEKIWSGFKSKHRTNIRRVYKNDIEIRSGHAELLDDFYHVMSHSWRDLGTPFYKKSYFQSLLQYFSPQDLKIFAVYMDGQPISVAMNGYFKQAVEGMWMGTVKEYRRLQPTYALYWEMIKDSCEGGYGIFHLGRSTADSTGEAFKKKWNAETKQLYWQYYMPDGSEMPQLNVDNAKFKLAIDIWKKLPLPIVGIIGPLISKSIP
ncbi:MAG: FemAB family PEP-CTERM system-associated protein [Candidatus Thiodiazotropha sp. (ex. Lucinisca nassula)]|nr:FemAB family PEP-CTERM system-associated protein [Candidatus Thiodiazotropha sp. (ex. Lucinisca nassula)]